MEADRHPNIAARVDRQRDVHSRLTVNRSQGAPDAGDGPVLRQVDHRMDAAAVPADPPMAVGRKPVKHRVMGGAAERSARPFPAQLAMMGRDGGVGCDCHLILPWCFGQGHDLAAIRQPEGQMMQRR